MHVQPDRVGVEIGEPGEIARLQADRADAQRRRVGEGEVAEGFGASMAAAFLCRSLYWAAWARDNRAGRGGRARSSVRACKRAARNGAFARGRGAASANPLLKNEVFMSVDTATVRRIAHLARIAVADDEVEHLQG